MAHRLGVAEVVDGNDLEVTATLEVSAEEVAADAAESIDAHACLRHAASLNAAAPWTPGRSSETRCGGPCLHRFRCRHAEGGRLCRPTVQPSGPPQSGGPEGKLRGRPPPLVEPRS